MDTLEFPRDLCRLRQFQNREFPRSFRYFARGELPALVKTHRTTLLYRLADSDVGYGHLDWDEATSRLFLGVCVIPEAQGQGVGRKIVEELIRRAEDTSIYLTVDADNIRARSLYESCGFVEIGVLGRGILYVRPNHIHDKL